ncbi:MAG TPA: hypothetical protein VJR49_00195, partial [Chthoniobacterales bacterium]|nr:hypothetical protein [Chthoniobacterales bacterium]
TGHIVFGQAALSNDRDGVTAESVLVMVLQTNEKKNANEEDDNGNADRGAGEKFEVEMFLAKKPIGDPTEEGPARFFG